MSSNILFCVLSILLFVLLIASEVRHKLDNHFIEREQAEIIKRQRTFIEAQRLIIKLYEKKWDEPIEICKNCADFVDKAQDDIERRADDE